MDISDPFNTFKAGLYAPEYNAYLDFIAYDVAVSGNYAYIAAWGRGFFIIDVSNKYNPYKSAHLSIGAVMGVALSGNHAFVVCESGNVRVIDI